METRRLSPLEMRIALAYSHVLDMYGMSFTAIDRIVTGILVSIHDIEESWIVEAEEHESHDDYLMNRNCRLCREYAWSF